MRFELEKKHAHTRHSQHNNLKKNLRSEPGTTVDGLVGHQIQQDTTVASIPRGLFSASSRFFACIPPATAVGSNWVPQPSTTRVLERNQEQQKASLPVELHGCKTARYPQQATLTTPPPPAPVAVAKQHEDIVAKQREVCPRQEQRAWPPTSVTSQEVD